MQAEAIAFDAFGTLFDLEALRDPLGDELFERFAARLVPWTWHATAAGAFRPLPEIARAAAEAAGAAEPEAVVEALQSPPRRALERDGRRGGRGAGRPLDRLARSRPRAVVGDGRGAGPRAALARGARRCARLKPSGVARK